MDGRVAVEEDVTSLPAHPTSLPWHSGSNMDLGSGRACKIPRPCPAGMERQSVSHSRSRTRGLSPNRKHPQTPSPSPSPSRARWGNSANWQDSRQSKRPQRLGGRRRSSKLAWLDGQIPCWLLVPFSPPSRVAAVPAVSDGVAAEFSQRGSSQVEGGRARWAADYASRGR